MVTNNIQNTILQHGARIFRSSAGGNVLKLGLFRSQNSIFDNHEHDKLI